METKNEEVVEVEENLDLPAIEEGEDDTTDWKAEAEKLQHKAISQRERTKTLKKELAEARKAVGIVAGSKEKPSQPSTGELDATQLDYLDLKGITESEDINLIQKVIQKTGQTVREALKDDYVVAKLASLKAERDVKAATPSSSRRSGDQSSNLAAAIAKFEETGVLPNDFELASQVTDAVTAKGNRNKPSWH